MSKEMEQLKDSSNQLSHTSEEEDFIPPITMATEINNSLIIISKYIQSLEKKIIELSAELDRYREKDRLTDLWARGEIEN